MAVIELVAIWTFLQSCVSAISCKSSTDSPAGIYYIAHTRQSRTTVYQSWLMVLQFGDGNIYMQHHVHASGDTDSARVANVMDPATDAVAFKRLLKWQRQKAAYTPSLLLAGCTISFMNFVLINYASKQWNLLAHCW
jgi:hypothetical protein